MVLIMKDYSRPGDLCHRKKLTNMCRNKNLHGFLKNYHLNDSPELKVTKMFAVTDCNKKKHLTPSKSKESALKDDTKLAKFNVVIETTHIV